jgi:F-type H+-transporting ATPase subunit epsilon
MPLKLDIVTPEKRVLSETVDSVVLPGTEGEFGVLPMHVPMVTMLAPGELVYIKNGKSEHFAIGTGFVEVTGESVAVLTDMAKEAEEIDEKSVQEALDRAQHALEHLKDASKSEEMAAAQAVIQKSLAQLHVKRRRHTI